MTFEQAQHSGIVNMVPHDPPARAPYVYTHRIALTDLISFASRMKERSAQYQAEEEAERRFDEAEKHCRVGCVTKELERLGNCVLERADAAAGIVPEPSTAPKR